MPASAVGDTQQADTIAAVIADVAPTGESVVAPDVVTTDSVTFTGNTDVTVSIDADAPVTIESTGSTVEIALPVEIDVGDGVVANDGTVVFEDNGTDAHAAVQALDDDSVRLQTILESPGAPSTYTYTFSDGAELVPLDDGSVEVTETIAGGVIAVIGLIDTPWAIDANGTSVPTHYTVDGNTLTQHVDHSDDYAYPITADPSIIFGWAIYVKYSKSDVRTVTTGLGGAINDKAKFAFALCARIPHPVAAAGCALVGSNYHSSIYNTFKAAKARNQCVEVQLAYGSFLPVVWKRYSC